MSSRTTSPKHALHVPKIADLEQRLGFNGEERKKIRLRLDCFKHNFTTGPGGIAGDELRLWKNAEHQAGLTLLAATFFRSPESQGLWLHGEGDDQALRRSRDDAEIVELLKQLFWRTNFDHQRNATQKEKKMKLREQSTQGEALDTTLPAGSSSEVSTHASNTVLVSSDTEPHTSQQPPSTDEAPASQSWAQPTEADPEQASTSASSVVDDDSMHVPEAQESLTNEPTSIEAGMGQLPHITGHFIQSDDAIVSNTRVSTKRRRSTPDTDAYGAELGRRVSRSVHGGASPGQGRLDVHGPLVPRKPSQLNLGHPRNHDKRVVSLQKQEPSSMPSLDLVRRPLASEVAGETADDQSHVSGSNELQLVEILPQSGQKEPKLSMYYQVSTDEDPPGSRCWKPSGEGLRNFLNLSLEQLLEQLLKDMRWKKTPTELLFSLKGTDARRTLDLNVTRHDKGQFEFVQKTLEEEIRLVMSEKGSSVDLVSLRLEIEPIWN